MKDEENPGNRAPDDGPNVGTDPMSLPQEGKHKATVHLDPEKVRRADKARARDKAIEDEKERSVRVKNA